ncbi:putative imidazole glycerol phosphate synthase subunit hisF2 [Lachnospiraceae bacterium]|uniref:AglZ/HisF2 family acetamidino modification protein n=1 Tax=Extibacter sp. GGCC_0201 TaxID=2731209 RepID=UPI001AA0DEC3|nr:AglZ/HisF2 family acetamidino modification protein [Extibacter sp. GGCC_0201]MBO1722612.1 imidazole glycerol phosphate synthase subunit HisF [Extibacter sp. GGCC_0201]BDF34565.1 putative imidazole glycerol phosphate synthase subunit hisF2 [Lachnospiraceae bacterium]BDF38567.1 putative imidazole glycerol phosphate synthase subunit hisF2 [Lachnospiraceae bacterium]
MYNRPRVIPCLLLLEQGLVKTTKFKNPNYLGDPINAVRIFNEKGVDELCLLDIGAAKSGGSPDFDYLKNIASEAFMPLSYGGGITDLNQIKELFAIGFEKVIINSAINKDDSLLKKAVEYAGSQSVVASIDAKRELFGKYSCFIDGGNTKIKVSPAKLAKHYEQSGAGEIIINSIDNDGLMQGYDIDLIRQVTETVNIPVVACGGAGGVPDLKMALEKGGAHAVSAGSMFVYFGRKKAVLINVPEESELYKEGVYCDE